MSELEPALMTPERDMADVIAIGGVATVKQMLPLYKPLLEGPSNLSPADRYIPIPRKLVGDREALEATIDAQLLEICAALTTRPVVVGHSLGAHPGVKFGLKHPDIPSEIVCLAGAQEGIGSATPSIKLLARFLGNPHGRKDLEHDSPYMEAHREEIAESWSPEVGLHLVAATVDDMFPGGHGLGIELPDGQEPHRRIVGIPGITRLTRSLFPRVPANTQDLVSLIPTSHYDIPRNRSVINYIRGIRLVAMAAQSREPVLPEPKLSQPELVAAAA